MRMRNHLNRGEISPADTVSERLSQGERPRRVGRRSVCVRLLAGCIVFLFANASSALASDACRLEVVDAENGWPVPLVELRTTHNLRFVSDNAGVIAVDAPELFGRETFFYIVGHGYGVPPDGFGYRGVRITPRPGKTIRVEVQRTAIARRLARLTGTGLLAESQKLGQAQEWRDAPVFGQDSVLTTRHDDRLFWVWGDTTLAHYPLGVFHTTAATTPLRPFEKLRPPIRPPFRYFLDHATGRPRAVAEMPGDGPTWLTGLISLPDAQDRAHLVATYSKIRGRLTAYERGLCEWDERDELFRRVRILWREGAPDFTEDRWHNTHAFPYTSDDGERRVAVGNPLPTVSFPARYEAWRDPSTWRSHDPPDRFQVAEDDREIEVHSGAIVHSAYRDRWITIFIERGGEPSCLGELWYAEADDPFGPWGPAVKILSHDNYTFYNPCVHEALTSPGDRFLLFEGTYTAQFADGAEPTPRHDYNQVLYRLDLDDPRLGPAQ